MNHHAPGSVGIITGDLSLGIQPPQRTVSQTSSTDLPECKGLVRNVKGRKLHMPELENARCFPVVFLWSRA